MNAQQSRDSIYWQNDEKTAGVSVNGRTLARSNFDLTRDKAGKVTSIHTGDVLIQYKPTEAEGEKD